MLVVSLPIWLVVLALSYYYGGLRSFYGSFVGAVMVAANFLSAVYTDKKALKRSFGGAQALVVGGIVARLAVLGVILYALSLIKAISMTAAILTFVVGYSILLPIGVIIGFGQGFSLKSGRRGPSSKDAGKEQRKSR